jgi:hypothetical protein
MPAVSKAQQRFMGMVHATQKGDMETPSKDVKTVAKSISKQDAKDFASTPHKGLPTKVETQLSGITEMVNDYVYKEDSGGGKPTWILKLGPESWERVKHLFDKTGRPTQSLTRIPAAGYVWNIHAQRYTSGNKEMYKIYGVAGDFTFGNAPMFYQQKYRGNKKAAKEVFDFFIKKYLGLNVEHMHTFEGSLTEKLIKDFASTAHKGLPDNIKEMILSELRSIGVIQKEYFSVVDDIKKTLSAYKDNKGTDKEKQIVSKLKLLNDKKKKLSDEMDGKVSSMYKDAELKVDEASTTASADGYATPYAFSKPNQTKNKNNKLARVSGGTLVDELDESVNENLNESEITKDLLEGKLNENRWIDIKNEDSPATTKVNKGISNINKQLAEIEKFLGWYGKLKSENGLGNEDLWKRTNSHIYSIKERLLNLERKLRKISE